jgi:gas vesicle protein
VERGLDQPPVAETNSRKFRVEGHAAASPHRNKESLMRDRDEAPYIVIEREGGGGLGSFVLGALVGAGLALLFAPQSGEDTQEDIKAGALKLKEAAQDRAREVQHDLEDRFTAARENVHARIESVREAVDSGRQAAHEAREELGQRLERSKAAYRAGIEAARDVAEAPEEAAEGSPVAEEA